jgi:hypothetical protein
MSVGAFSREFDIANALIEKKSVLIRRVLFVNGQA